MLLYIFQLLYLLVKSIKFPLIMYRRFRVSLQGEFLRAFSHVFDEIPAHFMSILLSMINFNASNLPRIELIFRWPKIILSDNCAFISLSLYFSSKVPILANEEGDLCKLL